jgi:hypothetical protein
LLETIADDFWLDLPVLGAVKPLNDVRVTIFEVIFGLEELAAQDLLAMLCGWWVASSIHTVLKRL